MKALNIFSFTLNLACALFNFYLCWVGPFRPLLWVNFFCIPVNLWVARRAWRQWHEYQHQSPEDLP